MSSNTDLPPVPEFTKRAAAGPQLLSRSSGTAAAQRETSIVVPSDTGSIAYAGIAATAAMLVLLLVGAALDLVAIDGSLVAGDAVSFSSFGGFWVAGAALIGAFAGGVTGGRLATMLGRVKPMAHAAAAWGAMVIASLVVFAAVDVSLLGVSVLSTTGTDALLVSVGDAGDALWWACAWLGASFLGMVGGWMFGVTPAPLQRRAPGASK